MSDDFQRQEDVATPRARGVYEERCEILCQALQMETPGYTKVPPAEVMQRDIKRLEDRLVMFPSDDYAAIAREAIDDLKRALKDYHKIG